MKPPPQGRPKLDDVAISKRLLKVSDGLRSDAQRLDEAVVEPASTDRCERIHASGLRASAAPRLAAMLKEPLEAENAMHRRAGWSRRRVRSEVTLHVQGETTADQLAAKIHGLRESLNQVAENLGRANVNAVLEVGGVAQRGLVWNVTTTATNMRLVEYGLKTAIGDQMRVQPSVSYVFRGQGDLPYPITERLLDADVPDLPPGVECRSDRLPGRGGDLPRPARSAAERAGSARAARRHALPARFPGHAEATFRRGRGDAGPGGREGRQGQPLYSGLVMVTVDPDIRYRDDPQAWCDELRVRSR